MPNNCVVVLCTTPDHETSTALASQVVEKKLAACVNILSGVTSVYEWKGKVEQDSEQLLIIKTTEDGYQVLETCLHQLHPYDTPEIIALDITHGLPDYLQWVADETKSKR